MNYQDSEDYKAADLILQPLRDAGLIVEMTVDDGTEVSNGLGFFVVTARTPEMIESGCRMIHASHHENESPWTECARAIVFRARYEGAVDFGPFITRNVPGLNCDNSVAYVKKFLFDVPLKPCAGLRHGSHGGGLQGEPSFCWECGVEFTEQNEKLGHRWPMSLAEIEEMKKKNLKAG